MVRPTRVACAWRTTLVSASCATRKSTVRLALPSASTPPNAVRWILSFLRAARFLLQACSAGMRPRSSSAAGRSSRANRWTSFTEFSTSRWVRAIFAWRVCRPLAAPRLSADNSTLMPDERLHDLVVQLASDFLSLLFLRRNDLARQQPEFALHDLRFHIELAILRPLLADDRLARLAPRDFAFEPAVALRQRRRVQPVRLPRRPLGRFQWNERLGDKKAGARHRRDVRRRADRRVGQALRRRQREHGLRVHERQIARHQSAGQRDPAQPLRPITVILAFPAQMSPQCREVAGRHSRAGIFHQGKFPFVVGGWGESSVPRPLNFGRYRIARGITLPFRAQCCIRLVGSRREGTCLVHPIAGFGEGDYSGLRPIERRNAP